MADKIENTYHFITELYELMKLHNVSIELENVWENEHETKAELNFVINGEINNHVFSTKNVLTITAEDIFKIIYTT